MSNIPKRLISLSDLLSRPEEEIDYVVETLLIKGGLGLLAGKPKAGKSTLARGLAFSVARGLPFLGLPTRQGAVLYYGLEEKESEIQRHFIEIGATGDEPMFISTKGLPGDPIDSLKRDIAACSPSLVIIDPLFRLVRARDANAYAEMTGALAPYMEVARETHAHILFVHHQGKSSRKGADGILGSTAIRGAMDVSILLNKSEHLRTIEIEGRYATALDETALEYDPVHKIYSLGQAKLDADGDRIGQSILSILQATPNGLTQPEIEEKVAGRTEWKRHALKKLREEGLITRTGMGNRGSPYLYFNTCSLGPM